MGPPHFNIGRSDAINPGRLDLCPLKPTSQNNVSPNCPGGLRTMSPSFLDSLGPSGHETYCYRADSVTSLPGEILARLAGENGCHTKIPGEILAWLAGLTIDVTESAL